MSKWRATYSRQVPGIPNNVLLLTLNEILHELESLKPEELHELQEAIQEHLELKATQKNTFHQALLKSGLVKEIKQPFNSQNNQRKLIEVQGKPVSETIIEERL